MTLYQMFNILHYICKEWAIGLAWRCFPCSGFSLASTKPSQVLLGIIQRTKASFEEEVHACV
jgi:hypothetical protein